MAKFFIQKVQNKNEKMLIQPTTLANCMNWIIENTISHPDNDDLRVDPNDYDVKYHIIRVK